MNANKSEMSEIRELSDDELDAVSGGNGDLPVGQIAARYVSALLCMAQNYGAPCEGGVYPR